MRRNGLRLHQGSFRLDIKEDFFMERIEQAAQGSGGLTTGSVLKRFGHGLVMSRVVVLVGGWT